MKFKNQTGFTLIELLVVIVIIGILATLTTVALSAAKVKARDAKRISDIKQMQTALELYYNEENTYPPTNALTIGQALVGAVSGKTFMGKVPAGPSSGEIYTYNQINGGTSYTLSYVLEKPVNEFAAGAAVALPGSINNQCTPNCSGKSCGPNGCGGICGTACTGSTPVCKSDYSACVACNTNSDCSGTPATPYCASNACSATRPTPCSDTTAAAVECTASSAYGAVCGGGTLLCKSDNAACGGANIVVAPSNCTNSNTCTCVTDTLTKAWDNSGVNAIEASPYTATSLNNGLNNLNGHNPSSIYEAAYFCAELNINGFDDWYLPSKYELCAMVRSGNYCSSLTGTCIAGNLETATNAALNSCTNSLPLVSGFKGAAYLSSTENSATNVSVQVPSNGNESVVNKTATVYYVRCVRRFN